MTTTTRNRASESTELGLFFFAALGRDAATTYRTVLDAARIADDNGLRFVSTPERHFHPFGGAFPNPAVLSAAIAATTRHIQIRAGSLITPLHSTLRCLEDWSLVDVLSGGRVAMSIGSGWNINDFVIAPDQFAGRRDRAAADLAALREGWRSGVWNGVLPTGEPAQVSVYPRPVQAELPIWTTASRNIDTFRDAGRAGSNLLTHLEQQEVAELGEKIDAYRQAWSETHGDDTRGTVTVMLHTYVGETAEQAERVGAAALRDYLLTAIDLEAGAVRAGGQMSGRREGSELLDVETARRRLAELGARRLLDGRSLIGTPEQCADVVESLREIGVDEIGCLIDFVTDSTEVLAGVERLGRVRAAAPTASLAASAALAASA